MGKDSAALATREEESKKIVKNYMFWSMGAGLIPFPLADLVAITGVQLKMLNDLSKHYDLPFSESRGKSIVASLVGSLGSTALASSAAGSVIKAIPVIGTALGTVTLPIFAGAVTYAVGKVFITHFEAGGTFLDLDPAKVREHFQNEFQHGKSLASDMDKKQK